MVSNWKTTAAGAGAIFGAAASLLTMISKGQIDSTMLTTDLGILSAGFAGIFAKDHNVTGGNIDNNTGAPVSSTPPYTPPPTYAQKR